MTGHRIELDRRGAAGYLEVEGVQDTTIFDGPLTGPGH
jgi:hypothetical protein